MDSEAQRPVPRGRRHRAAEMKIGGGSRMGEIAQRQGLVETKRRGVRKCWITTYAVVDLIGHKWLYVVTLDPIRLFTVLRHSTPRFFFTYLS